MEHVSTPNECKRIEMGRKDKMSALYTPSKQSLSLIMQFAAVYHVEKDLPLNSLSEIILN